ncbi:MAG: radical SAM protein [Spirochaetales bacterium]|nr:radical SAM protein [Spirochaetales bacterium]
MTILLISPPFCQLNTPYPGTAFLTAWLKEKGHQVYQADTGLETYLRLFGSSGLKEIVFSGNRPDSFFETINNNDSLKRIWQLRQQYYEVIDPVLSFLQGKDSTMATLLCRPGFLPEGERFSGREEEEYYGSLGITDRARLRATLVLEDLADFYRQTEDPDFGFSRYAERLGLSPPSFDELYSRAQETESSVSRIHREVLKEKMELYRPGLAGFSVPFPGNLLESLRGAAFIRQEYPEVHLTLGGGYINTELREIQDIRLAEFFDSVTLDDGEDALEALCTRLETGEGELTRTWLPAHGMWKFHHSPAAPAVKHSTRPAPDYSGLLPGPYLSLVDRENPMHRLWSEGPWVKMMLAHGCYWKRCAFCDTSLDYIGRFDPGNAAVLADQIENLIRTTGLRSFHFVDEAAPPSLMRELALELIRRGCRISWWTNIRFETNFTPQLCRLLARSGCIAVSGGLEVASDRLLDQIDKGVTVAQVSRVAAAFRNAGIMVHAYLMDGFPGQTVRELADSLDVVRQLFQHELIQSAYWHHFALTAHSPVGRAPEQFGVTITGPESSTFARNDLEYTQKAEDLSLYGPGLNAALYNYMRGEGFEVPLKKWFAVPLPGPRVDRYLIKNLINRRDSLDLKDTSRLVWYEALPETCEAGLIFRAADYQEVLECSAGEADFIIDLLRRCRPGEAPFTLRDFDSLADTSGLNGDEWLSSESFRDLIEYGLLVL